MTNHFIITGAPRSGLAMTAAALVSSGAFCTSLVRNQSEQTRPTGGHFHAYEHPFVRELITKPALAGANTDPDGIQTLGNPHSPALPEDIATKYASILAGDGYDGSNPLIWKDHRALLMWPTMLDRFPDMIWILVARDPERIARAAANTQALNIRLSSGRSLEQWRAWAHHYVECTKQVAKHTENFFVLQPEKFVRGDYTEAEALSELLGLEFDKAAFAAYHNPNWKRI